MAITTRRIVLIESPFASEDPAILQRNVAYVRAAMRDCLARGEAPFASHAVYTLPGVLNDRDPDQRRMGMEAGFAFHQVADLVVVYTDYGISPGMLEGIHRAREAGIAVEHRALYGDDSFSS